MDDTSHMKGIIKDKSSYF